MSGGSYNYLCHASCLDELLGQAGDLEAMANRLAELGAKDASRETWDLILSMRVWESKTRTIMDRLADVFRSVEWLDSGDYSMEQVEESLAKYRGEIK